MAILNRLRSPWIMFGAIGLAMVAFILTDQFSNIGNPQQASNAGVIDGDVVTTQEFQNALTFKEESYRRTTGDNEMQRTSSHQLNQQLWDEMVREKLQGNEYDKLGIAVTNKELFNIIINFDGIKNDSSFINPNTGQFDPLLFERQLEEVLSNDSEDEQVRFVKRKWKQDEEDTRDGRLNEKYFALIQKGLYVTNAEAKKAYFESGQTVSFNYIQKPYTTDESVEVSESDIKKYYNAHKNEYKVTEPTRSFEYVLIQVEPSEEDKQVILDELTGLMNDRVVFNKTNELADTIVGLKNTTEDSLFVEDNSDFGFDPTYYPKDRMPSPIDSIFETAAIGTTYGPYEFGNRTYAISKLLDTKTTADSARARHILIAYQGAERVNPAVTRNAEEAKVFADSLLNVVKNDRSKFDEIAKTLSDGPSGKDGGDLKWFGQAQMTPKFSEFVFNGNKGDLDVVETEFGFHIIEVTDISATTSKQYKMAHIVRKLEVGEKTEEEKYNEAFSIAQSESFEDFQTKVQEQGLQIRPVQDLKPFDQLIRGLGNNRDMVRWAFNADVNEGDFKLFDLDEQFIVAHLSAKIEGEYKTLDQVRGEVERKVRKEKQADVFIKEFADASGAGNLEQIATSIGLTVKSQGATFGNSTLESIGAEPKVIGTVFGLAPGVVSEPIEGEFGVYLVSVTASTPQAAKEDYSAEKTSLTGRNSTLVNGVFQMLKDEYQVEDNRYQFY